MLRFCALLEGSHYTVFQVLVDLLFDHADCVAWVHADMETGAKSINLYLRDYILVGGDLVLHLET